MLGECLTDWAPQPPPLLSSLMGPIHASATGALSTAPGLGSYQSMARGGSETQNRKCRRCGRSGIVTVNRRRVEESSLPLRPDIVVRRPDGSMLIIDVTVPFEDRVEALEKARQLKATKYQSLVDDLATKGISSEVNAIIVGALGSWETCNDYVLGQLGVSRKYATMMRKIICARTIGYS
ncbi:hypothetical protein JTE90_020545 [Oedothorax gibbosus]|uniref:Reverse transcriptase n=1 Tax=Oedothorax gibbosus TaxID=931172 RepID=A0AAV6VWU4_9ARAC|nr:hypothetical protein JTE90_020545 [Oedothorax gibbosus]